MKTKRKIEILQLILEYLNNKNYGFKYDDDTINSYGICGILKHILFTTQITTKEFNCVMRYIKNNKPNTIKYFYGFWWDKIEVKSRIKFINNLINTLTNETK